MPRKRKIAPQNAPGPAKVAKRNRQTVDSDQLESGTVLIDYNSHEWTVDSKFTKGTFGSLYLGHCNQDPDQKPYVIKVESMSKGSLFQESVVYERICQEDKIEKWKQRKGLEFLGIPNFVASGRHETNSGRYRFLVVEKFGDSLEQKHSGRKSNKLPSKLAFSVAIDCLDTLEYLAENGYVHADLKAQNLVASLDDPTRFYLIDYGLSFKVPTEETYQENPKVAHEGTPLFTSTDAHKGCTATFRGDVEILGYNLLYWLSGKLPWAKQRMTKDGIMAAKLRFQNNTDAELRKLLGQRRYAQFSESLIKFYEHIYSCEYMQVPNYEYLRNQLKPFV